MNDENQMREELLQQNGIEHKTVPPPKMKVYKEGFWYWRITRFALILFTIALWIAASATYIAFSANTLFLAIKYSQLADENGREFNQTIMPVIISCCFVPFVIAAAGILTYYLYSTSKHGMMKDIQKRLIELEDQLSSQTNQN